jgi:hypothetical protein
LGVFLYLSSTRRGLFVELLEELWGIEVTVVDPAVVSGWVPFPMDEVLEFTSSSVSSCISNVLYFVFFVILFRHRGCRDSLLYKGSEDDDEELELEVTG